MTEFQKLTRKQLIAKLRRLESEQGSGEQVEGNVQEIDYLRHELDVYQIELEMQNRELRDKQQELELARDKYADLYDFAPISFLSMDKNGVIREINLTATMLLGKPRSQLLNKPFITLLAPGYSFDFFRALREVLATGKEQSLELLLQRNNMIFDVFLHMVAPDSSKTEVRIALQDISGRKRAEDKTHELLRQNRELTQRLFQVQEEERRHLARELHDEFGQWLTAIQLNAANICQLSKEKDPHIYASARIIDESVSEMHKDIRNMIHQLRPTLLDELGMAESIKYLVGQWREQHPEVEVTLVLDGELDNLKDDINITLYRVIQESLTNVAKYAEAHDVAIELSRQRARGSMPDSLLLCIEDNGKGMDTEMATEGFGLAGMRERVLAVNGEFTNHSLPGKGVKIEISIPINQ